MSLFTAYSLSSSLLLLKEVDMHVSLTTIVRISVLQDLNMTIGLKSMEKIATQSFGQVAWSVLFLVHIK